ncbi:ABC-type nickel/cobalt efflux system permease component RcnA [Hoeflea marina]|uniref:Nickel/cobalt efflux system n=1 Tax=Hoeflea marina TaxID=274592 RepID=A0A317PEK6_9HYPH|nr:nickel/cobalt transporter [Hoeflea marina]PWV97164.1 ABC-type nickel/cobalt efflux system permease component RcnA [Hoeflea marina]
MTTNPACKLLTIAALMVMAAGAAHAQSSLGIGAAEPSLMPGNPGWPLLSWVNSEQQAFYRALTGSLKAMRSDPWQLWTLVGLSFAYGVFHAVGPGHGKAVISSYMIANEVALRRGVALSFLSSMMQGLMAIGVVALAYVVLRGTTVSMTDATGYLEKASYLLIAAFGGWLLWKKLAALLPARVAGLAPALAVAAAGDHGHGHHDHQHSHGHAHSHSHAHHPHAHGPGEVCSSCGHSHAPDPALLSGKDLGLREAWSAVVAVGLRPCSGALLVLTFSLLNGLYLGGVLSVFAMALGTAITVSALATLAVTAKGFAVRLAGSSRAGAVGSSIEIAGATLVLVLGLVLFAAALQA